MHVLELAVMWNYKSCPEDKYRWGSLEHRLFKRNAGTLAPNNVWAQMSMPWLLAYWLWNPDWQRSPSLIGWVGNLISSVGYSDFLHLVILPALSSCSAPRPQHPTCSLLAFQPPDFPTSHWLCLFHLALTACTGPVLQCLLALD